MEECMLTIRVAGRVVTTEPIEFSGSGEATVRLCSGAARIDVQETALEAEVAAGGAILATAVAPAADEWISMPGATQSKSTLAVDVPGFTICFDACSSGNARWCELKAVRVVRQRIYAAGTAASDGDDDSSASEGASGDGCLDAADAAAMPALARCLHGPWLRQAARPGPAALAWPGVVAGAAALDSLRSSAQALVRQHCLGGRTFWIDRQAEPRCSLERAALDVLAFHEARRDAEAGAGGAGEGEGEGEGFVGAEWWVQLRSGPTLAADGGGGGGEGCDDLADASSIAFHYDCDECLISATGEHCPPWLSTVTYLTGVGAPTLVLPSRADAAGDAAGCAEGVGVYVSYPWPGKHLCFDGTLLHGCPHALSPQLGPSQPAEPRVTLLVNIWLRHRPHGPRPLPQRVAAAIASTADGSPGRSCLVPPGSLLGAAVPHVVRCPTGPTTGSERRFAPSARRRELSPAAKTICLRRFPSSAELRGELELALGSGAEQSALLLHAPAAVLVEQDEEGRGT